MSTAYEESEAAQSACNCSSVDSCGTYFLDSINDKFAFSKYRGNDSSDLTLRYGFKSVSLVTDPALTIPAEM